MDIKNNEKDILNSEHDKKKLPNDYKLLVQKLRNIRNIINLLEKKFLNIEI